VHLVGCIASVGWLADAIDRPFRNTGYYRARLTENDRGCTIAGRQGQTYNLTLAATTIALDGDQCLRLWAGGLWNNDSLADPTTLPMLIDKRVPQRSSGLARTNQLRALGVCVRITSVKQ